MGAIDGRRGFFRNLMMLTAGATATTTLGGCAAPGEADGDGPMELVTLRPGTLTRSPLPGRIPAVRTVHYEPIRSGETVSSKADRWSPAPRVAPPAAGNAASPAFAGG